MIYKNIWLYVKPSTGIPLFLSAVVIGSFAVHLALFTSVQWLKPFYNGKASVAATADAVPALPAAVVAKI
ncbi:light-harvesting protein [Rhodoferax antarcticus]|uniref:light-harvesting protein n=1 Tax=Rhodoferax antarcticus TaxID=81479 RepID=UPI00222521D3|nr:light-harvesting protein [Rhodoferax antarcticus]MCW2310431.1 light-harvesting protein B-800-850 alpha chain [Rhodoferax antarcticus]